MLRKKGIHFRSFPLEDRGVPTSLAKTEQLIAQLASDIRQGKNVAIHCRQGIGRSTLVSAAVLIASGEDLEAVLKEISIVRGVKVPETAEQRDWLAQFAKAHSLALARQNR